MAKEKGECMTNITQNLISCEEGEKDMWIDIGQQSLYLLLTLKKEIYFNEQIDNPERKWRV